MKNLLFPFIFFLISNFILAGCATSKLSPYNSETNDTTATNCDELIPRNPYSNDSGHDAGYKWAQKNNPSSCFGNSISFTEGCEEYTKQLADYQACLDK